MRGAVLALVLTGCGRIAFDPTVDASTIDTPDARVPRVTVLTAPTPRSDDFFGQTAVLSADGNTLVVAAEGDDGATGTRPASGAAYVFVRSGDSWAVQARLEAANADANDRFGTALGISADGNTVAVGAVWEASSAVGVGGNALDNSVLNSGAAYVFVRSGTSWAQQAYVKATNTGATDHFGYSLALSADGATLAVGAIAEDSAAVGMNGNQADNSMVDAGAVYIYTRAGTVWSPQAYLKASNTGPDDLFGFSLGLSATGSMLVCGAIGEDSRATGVGGDQTNDLAAFSGAVYVFTRAGPAWTQQAYLKASNTDPDDRFGVSLGLAEDGATLVVTAYGEDSRATGVGGDQGDDGLIDSGAAYVFTRAGTAWFQQAYLKASNPAADDFFGFNGTISGDGRTIAIGAEQEDGSAADSGAAYVLIGDAGAWAQRSYLKAPSPGPGDLFGDSLGLSRDGSVLAISARFADTGTLQGGAIYVYE